MSTTKRKPRLRKFQQVSARVECQIERFNGRSVLVTLWDTNKDVAPEMWVKRSSIRPLPRRKR